MAVTLCYRKEKHQINKSNIAWRLFFSVVLFLVPVLLSVYDAPLEYASYRMRIAPGSELAEILQRENEGVHVYAYVFNVTNAERFLAGDDDKMHVEEVGPFVYKELRSNIDLQFHEESESISYIPHINTEFMPELSVADPRDVNITMPNVAKMGIGSAMSAYPYLTRLAFNVLAEQLNSPTFVSLDAHSYLWGYDEPLIKLGHQFIPGMITFPRLGLLDRLYDKNLKFRLETGSKRHNRFQIMSLDGAGGLNKWGYEDPSKRTRCNTFEDAYEGLAFPALTKDTPIRIYRNILCRMLELDYESTENTEFGGEALLFRISNRTYSINNDTKCLCASRCSEGLSDVSPCVYGFPLTISNAHFTGAAPSLYERVGGMQPDPVRHASQFLFEPKLGFSLMTKFTVQVNLAMDDMSYSSELRKFSHMAVPICYFRIEQPPLQPDLVFQLKIIYTYIPYITVAIQILCVVGGIFLLWRTFNLIYWKQHCMKEQGMNYEIALQEKSEHLQPAQEALIKA